MPEMDGMEMLRRVKRHNGIVQVMVITASGETDDLLKALEARANDFLLKPLDKRSLEDALENALARITRWKSTLLELFQRKKRVHQEPEKAASQGGLKIEQP